MPLHKRYELVKKLVDSHFVRLSRAAHARDPQLERIEIWHDALEAALKADRGYEGEPDENWEVFILKATGCGSE
jgi:hypothetical protein